MRGNSIHSVISLVAINYGGTPNPSAWGKPFSIVSFNHRWLLGFLLM